MYHQIHTHLCIRHEVQTSCIILCINEHHCMYTSRIFCSFTLNLLWTNQGHLMSTDCCSLLWWDPAARVGCWWFLLCVLMSELGFISCSQDQWFLLCWRLFFKLIFEASWELSMRAWVSKQIWARFSNF
jgi:hypothetical protein